MPAPAFARTVHGSGLPLILSCPHSGREMPDDFHFVCARTEIDQSADPYVDELLVLAEQNASLLVASFPRAYIDVNRSEDDLDPAVLAEPWPLPLQPSAATLRGLGLVRRLTRTGQPVYAAALSAAAVQHRLENYYRPYHAAVQDQLTLARSRHGRAWLLDCHSMLSRAAHDPSIRYADFVLGDRDGQSCSVVFRDFVQLTLQGMGYQVAINDPYKGVEIMRRYGNPTVGYEALQLEINRDLYWDEVQQCRHGGFARLQHDLAGLVSKLREYIDDQLSVCHAAE